VAWALGLAEDSALVPVTDVLLSAPQRGLDPDTALAHLLAIPAFTEPVAPEDRRWHSWPGTELISLAFELGYPQVLTRDSKVLRVGPDQAAALEAQVRRFEEKFGRPPGPDDPLFFDPDADEPQPVSLTGLETETVAVLEAAGICPAWIYAYQHTDGLLPRSDGSFASARDQAEWDEVISRYIRVHQLGTVVDHQAETRKLATITTIMTLQMAADDPGYGAAMAAQLAGTAGGPPGTDPTMLREYLRACAGELGGTLRADRAVAQAAAEHARAWGGASLASRLQQAARAGARDAVADDVLLATAVALIQSPGA
jgi:hypothetical protein